MSAELQVSVNLIFLNRVLSSMTLFSKIRKYLMRFPVASNTFTNNVMLNIDSIHSLDHRQNLAQSIELQLTCIKYFLSGLI